METRWLGSERRELGKEVLGNALGADGYGFEKRDEASHFYWAFTPVIPTVAPGEC